VEDRERAAASYQFPTRNIAHDCSQMQISGASALLIAQILSWVSEDALINALFMRNARWP
jgi:hypothetical protein